MTRYFGAHTLEGEWHTLLPRYVLLSDRVDGKQILDIGCATGIGSSLLLEMGALEVNGIDHRPEVLELARVKHAKQGLNFQVMFWEELDFPDDAFDIVLCLDPTSPVTDPSLLLEVKRVLRPGGEYICAIERRNVDGLETILPQYGYASTGEELELTQSGERVPQIGKLEEFFDSVGSVIQKPHYTYVFDRPGEEDDSAMPQSGPEAGDEETSPESGLKSLPTDRRLAGDEEPGSVEMFFCGDEQMSLPTALEVEMPYREVVERLQQLISELQLRQHPDGPPSSSETTNPRGFRERQQTSEFQPLPSEQTSPAPGASQPADEQPAPGPDDWRAVRKQLHEMTQMYRQMRTEMENLFVQTRQELAERDRYIEQLFATVRQWQQQRAPDEPGAEGSTDTGAPESEMRKTTEFAPEFERQSTTIFSRPAKSETDDAGAFDASDKDTADSSHPTKEADDEADESKREATSEMAPEAADSALDEDSEPDDAESDAESNTEPDSDTESRGDADNEAADENTDDEDNLDPAET